ncbi:MAG: Cache 3/Cache 2 fusion domain-containing protein [Desulfuromonadaceae bacterium]|nr:Cache 3/Cache 2 fusion domain-containing protein [Desulfuromonadaceae bacterium]
MKIRTKIIGMGLLLVLLTATSIVGIAMYQENVLKRNVGDEVDLLVRSEIKNVAQNVYLMCRTMQETLEQMLEHGLNVIADVATRQGDLDFKGSPTTWQAVNQFTDETTEVTLPKVLYNGSWLGRNADLNSPTAIVDEVTALLGVTCTVFQRMNEAGDMLRVATTVPGLHKNRAISTYIPRYNPDGSSNPVIDTLLKGETYTGRAYVVNAWYLTGYQPLWNPSGTKVVGALYVGQKQENVTSLRRGIMDIVIGQSGYVAVIGGKGGQQGKYIISRDGQRDGENLLQVDDALQKTQAEKYIQLAVSLENKQGAEAIPVVMNRYVWQNSGDQGPRDKIAALAYFEPWDWIIIASAYEEDFYPVRQRMASALSNMIGWITGVASIIIVLSLLIGYYVARGIVRPLEKAMEVFEQIGQGRLDLQLNTEDQDEIGQLSRSFNSMVVNLSDITASRDELNHEIIERIRIENELRETSDRGEDLEQIVNNSPVVAFLWSAEDGWPVEYVSPNICQFGLDAEDFHKGRLLFSSVVHEEDLARVQAAVDRHSAAPVGRNLALEYRILNRRGEEFWIENRLWLRRNNAGKVTHCQGVVLDITSRKKAEESIHKLAFYDNLTGLPNRSLFMNRLQQALAQAQRDERLAALLFIDLDRFKEVNDQYGHAVGDKLLHAVGLRLASCIRQNDTLARLGGDEFIMLISSLKKAEDLRRVADKILSNMAEPFCIDQHRLDISTSIGIALYPQDGEDTDLLLKRADVAMYVAKDMGRNGYCFYNSKMERNSRQGYIQKMVTGDSYLRPYDEMV